MVPIKMMFVLAHMMIFLSPIEADMWIFIKWQKKIMASMLNPQLFVVFQPIWSNPKNGKKNTKKPKIELSIMLYSFSSPPIPYFISPPSLPFLPSSWRPWPCPHSWQMQLPSHLIPPLLFTFDILSFFSSHYLNAALSCLSYYSFLLIATASILSLVIPVALSLLHTCHPLFFLFAVCCPAMAICQESHMWLREVKRRRGEESKVHVGCIIMLLLKSLLVMWLSREDGRVLTMGKKILSRWI